MFLFGNQTYPNILKALDLLYDFKLIVAGCHGVLCLRASYLTGSDSQMSLSTLDQVEIVERHQPLGHLNGWDMPRWVELAIFSGWLRWHPRSGWTFGRKMLNGASVSEGWFPDWACTLAIWGWIQPLQRRTPWPHKELVFKEPKLLISGGICFFVEWPGELERC